MIRAVRNGFLNEYILIMIGCFFVAVSLNAFLEPNEIVIGGITGLAIIIERLSRKIIGFAIPMWFSNTFLNLPLFALSIKIYGFKFLNRTVFATLFLSFALFVTDYFPDIEIDYPIACVFGSVLSGAGLGLIFRNNATTGGSDLAASLLHKYIKNLSISHIMLFIDVAIIGIGFFAFGTIPAFYAIIGAYIIAKVIDVIVEGVDFAKAVLIISEKSDEIGNAIINEMNRGATKLYGEGAYTGNKKNIILCVVQIKEISKVKEITKYIDESAFVIVADVKEVLGDFVRVRRI